MEGIKIRPHLRPGSRVSFNFLHLLNSDIKYRLNEEIVTNTVWVDSRPIYTKVLCKDLSGSDTSIAHGVVDIGDYRAIDCAHSYVASNGVIRPFPLVTTSTPSQYNSGVTAITEANISLEIGSGRAGTYYITLMYTKASDTPR